MTRYFEDDKDNVAFERCIDVMSRMLMKYGPQILQKHREQMARAIEMESRRESRSNNLRMYWGMICKSKCA